MLHRYVVKRISIRLGSVVDRTVHPMDRSFLSGSKKAIETGFEGKKGQSGWPNERHGTMERTEQTDEGRRDGKTKEMHRWGTNTTSARSHTVPLASINFLDEYLVDVLFPPTVVSVQQYVCWGLPTRHNIVQCPEE